MARPAFVPTPEMRADVRTRAGLGVPHAAIARRLNIGEVTLRKYFKDELVRGIDEANAQVSQSIFNSATGRYVQDDGTIKRGEPNPTLAIWWAKCRMGWRPPAEETNTLVKVEGNARVSVYLPDHRRSNGDMDEDEATQPDTMVSNASVSTTIQ